MQQEKTQQQELFNQFQEQLDSLEKRISSLEKSLKTAQTSSSQTFANESMPQEEDIDISIPFTQKGSIEFGIGEYGMAWLGNIVLLIAIVFFVQQIHNSGNPLLSILTGYASVAGIYLISYFAKKSYLYLSNLFKYSGHLLLFYLTLRLHFIQNPIVENLTVGLVVVLAILGILFYLSYRKKSQVQISMVLLMALASGIISNSTHYLLSISVLTAIIALHLYNKFGWIKTVIAFITFIYAVQFIWLINNPFITKVAELRGEHNYYIFYLVFTGIVFSLLTILPKKEKISDEILIFTIIWNGLGFTALLIPTTFLLMSDHYVLIFSLISAFCLAFSVIIQSRSRLKICASIYAIYGFVAMSVAIYGLFLFPKGYTLLAIQSFLVVSMALWFRSQFIVVVNTFMFLILLVFYIKDPISYNSTNFSFMLVAFVTARVINWKKDRLNLKTELLRNLYLVAGFVMTLISINHAIPDSSVTVSWIITAVVFFILSVALKNIKYRWLAIATLVASAINLLFVDMSDLSIESRVLIFLFLAVISITISILYTKYISKKRIQNEPENEK